MERFEPAGGALGSAARACLGREAELAELERGLAAALAGQGQLYLLSGEPGIGKTRVCDELSARAHAQGARVLWGRCWEAGGAPAYFPWREPLSAMCALLDDGALAACAADGAPGLIGVLPALRARLPAQTVAGDAPEQARFAFYAAVAALVRRAAAERGLLLVLDDLHAADESSLLLLCFLVRELRGMRTLVLATFRDVEARLSPEVAHALDRVTREGASLPLERLSAEASARLLQSQAGALEPGVISEVFRRTQGNPLFLAHMAQVLRKHGPAELARGALPSGVRELIRQQLARVSPAAHALLEVAAISGDELDPECVAQAAALEPGHASALFDEALDAGLLVAASRGRLRFSHALVREVLERDLRAERRCALHGAIFAVLERPHLDPEGAPYAQLAHHGLHGPEAVLQRAARYALLAARRALGVFAFDQATAVLERALGALGEGQRALGALGEGQRALGALGEGQRAFGDERERDTLRCELFGALGEAQIRSGHGALGQASCLRAIELARGLGDAERMARAALLYGLEISAALVNVQLVALLQEALAALPDEDSRLRVAVSARLAAAMQPHHDLQYPIDLANQAIASARRIGDAPALLDALYTGMAAMMDIVDPRQRIPLNLEIEQLAHDAGDREKLLRTQARLAFDHMELGDLAGADARIAAFERLVRQLGARRYLWRVPLFHSMRAMLHGRFSAAEALIAEARELGREHSDQGLERCLVFHREGLLRAAERHEEMIAFDPDARQLRAALYSGPHWQNGGSAFSYARIEDRERVRLYLDLIPQDDWPLVRNPPAFMHLGEPLALIGEHAAVERVYAQLLPASHRCISWGWTALLWDGSASRVLALLAARLERWDEADAHFAHALAELTRMDALPYLARTRYEHARALIARGRTHDRELARRRLDEACALADRLAMSGLLRLAERQLAAAGQAPTAVPAAAVAASEHAASALAAAAAAAATSESAALPSFVQEGEYWSIAYAGATVRLRDSLGLQYLARLIAEPDRELHVLELSRISGTAPALRGGASFARADDDAPVDRGDAGELLDEVAKQRYRARLALLRESEREAEAEDDAAGAARAREEIEALAAELSRAVGLGGRARRAGAASERARSAVQRRIRNAVERIRERSPALADLIERSVRTGTVCTFRSERTPRA